MKKIIIIILSLALFFWYSFAQDHECWKLIKKTSIEAFLFLQNEWVLSSWDIKNIWTNFNLICIDWERWSHWNIVTKSDYSEYLEMNIRVNDTKQDLYNDEMIFFLSNMFYDTAWVIFHEVWHYEDFILWGNDEKIDVEDYANWLADKWFEKFFSEKMMKLYEKF